MKKLRVIKEDYLNSKISAEEAIQKIFNTYLISEEVLLSNKLEIKHHDYGIYQLKRDGDYYMESDIIGCLEYASEIIERNERRNQ